MEKSRRDVLAFLGSAAVLSLVPAGSRAASADPVIPLESGSPKMLDAARALIQRVVPSVASRFVVDQITPDDGRDTFEIEGRGRSIILRGNNGISIASALNYYLKYYCHRQLTPEDTRPFHGPLSTVSKVARVTSPFQRRACFNYCTFSYTAAWWDWERWQREVDWMAMRGVNMPLAITGQEATWQQMLRRFRMNDEEIRIFFCGPAFFAWQWMACLEGWGGPLPQSWIDSHKKLGQQILERERELGMTPILQGFTGFVPRLIKDKFPDAHIQIKQKWDNFEGTAQLDPLDPLFRQMGTAFLEEQKNLFGTDHFYAADPFIEDAPPNSARDYLPSVAKKILATAEVVDPDAVIVMQTWSLRKPLVVNIPQNKIILLSLTGKGWQKTDGFWDRPWVVGILPNFGGEVAMAGSLRRTLSNALTLRTTQAAGQVTGIGMFPEGMNERSIIYNAGSEIAWMQKPPDASDWLHKEIVARYGKNVHLAQSAWSILLRSLYADGNGAEEGSLEIPICARPALFLNCSSYGSFKRHYDPELVWQAWETLQAASGDLKYSDAYRYDVVDLARQALADLSLPLYSNICVSYLKDDSTALKTASTQFLELAKDMDSLLGTRREFLLGCWLEASKRQATNAAERKQYEQNARLLITVWGPRAPDAVLFDYSARQWSGLISGYYVPRWERFLEYLASQPSGAGRFTGKNLKLEVNRPSDEANAFYAELSMWENAWCNRVDIYKSIPSGDSIQIAAQLLAKWNSIHRLNYENYDLQTLSVKNKV